MVLSGSGVWPSWGTSEGIPYAQEAIQIAEEVDNPYSLMYAYAGAGILWLLRGSFHRLSPCSNAAPNCAASGFPDTVFLDRLVPGNCLRALGASGRAIPLLEQAVEYREKLRVSRSIVIARLGEAYLLSVAWTKPSALASRRSKTPQQKERGYEAYALRLLGKITAQSHPPTPTCPSVLPTGHGAGA